MATRIDLAKRPLQRAGDDEAATKAMLRYDAEDPELVDRETALHWATSAVAWARGIVEAVE